MAIGKNATKNTTVKNTEQKTEVAKPQYSDDFVTTAIIKPMNVYDQDKGEYTTEINQKTLKVETFVVNLKEEKPQTIGYISIATINRFLNGEVKAVPIKMRKQ